MFSCTRVIGSLEPLPNFGVRVADANLRHGIAVNLDGEPEAFPDVVRSALIGILDGLNIPVPRESCGPTYPFSSPVLPEAPDKTG
jgi:hypothetical protein